MNFDKLGSSGIVRLRPKATRQMPNGEWMEIDEDWRVETAHKTNGIELRNLRSHTVLRLNADHVVDYMSDLGSAPDVKRGFLNLKVKVAISNTNGVAIEPMSLVEQARNKPTNHTPQPGIVESDSWDVIAQRYASRPAHWEFLLTADYIEDALISADKKLRELNSGLIYRRVESVSEGSVFPKTRELFAEMISIADQIDPTLKAIQPAWGPLGTPGDAGKIQQACKRLKILTEALVEWEVEVYFIRPTEDKYSRLFETLRGSALTAFEALSRIPKGLREGVEKAKATPGNHVIDLRLKLDSPPNLKAFNREAKRLQGGLFSWF